MGLTAKGVATAAALIMALGAASAALSDGGPMEGTIKARQAHMREINAASKAISDQLQAPAPDLAAIRAAAKTLKDMGQAMPGWFPAGSGPESGVKTRAKPEIWTNAADFAADVTSFKAAGAKLSDVAGGGDIAAIKAQMGATGLACGACHFAYRGPPIPAAAPAI